MALRESPPFRNRIDALIKTAERAESIELQDHLARYLCVLISGYVEVVIREIVVEYARQRCQQPVQKYVSESLQNFWNPKYNKICDLIKAFDADLLKNIEEKLLEEEKDAINSIVARRHEIAHGRGAGLSLGSLKDYRARVESALVKIERSMLGETTLTPPLA